MVSLLCWCWCYPWRGGGRPNSCYNNMMEKVVELTININMVECVVVFMWCMLLYVYLWTTICMLFPSICYFTVFAVTESGWAWAPNPLLVESIEFWDVTMRYLNIRIVRRILAERQFFYPTWFIILAEQIPKAKDRHNSIYEANQPWQ